MALSRKSPFAAVRAAIYGGRLDLLRRGGPRPSAALEHAALEHAVLPITAAATGIKQVLSARRRAQALQSELQRLERTTP